MGPQEDYIKYGVLGQPLYYLVYGLELWRTPLIQFLFAIVGTFAAGVALVQFGYALWPFIRPSRTPAYCHSVTGSWALVTGASDGIGYAFGEELLDRGFNVLLHGRNSDKLKRVKAELEAKYPRRKIDIVVADAGKSDDAPQRIAEKVKQLPGKLTVLVNNVGGITTLPRYSSFMETNAEAIDICININARFPSLLTNALLPTLKSNQPSLIINTGSASSEMASPIITTYAATKAYIKSLSRSLKAEMLLQGNDGVDVTGCLIGNTTSAGNPFDIPLFTISSRECARGCLNGAGYSDSVVFCHWRHAVHIFLGKLAPESVLRKMFGEQMMMRKNQEEEQLKAQ